MRKINKVAVLGSGVMGSRIACHFANIGVEVLLLDIVPKEAAAGLLQAIWMMIWLKLLIATG